MGIALPTHRPPTHPGEMLNEEYIKPLGLTQVDVATRLGISFPRLNSILNAKRGVTPDTALRLERLFGASAQSWLNLQTNWDLWHELHEGDEKGRSRVKPIETARLRASLSLIDSPLELMKLIAGSLDQSDKRFPALMSLCQKYYSGESEWKMIRAAAVKHGSIAAVSRGEDQDEIADGLTVGVAEKLAAALNAIERKRAEELLLPVG